MNGVYVGIGIVIMFQLYGIYKMLEALLDATVRK